MHPIFLTSTDETVLAVFMMPAMCSLCAVVSMYVLRGIASASFSSMQQCCLSLSLSSWAVVSCAFSGSLSLMTRRCIVRLFDCDIPVCTILVRVFLLFFWRFVYIFVTEDIGRDETDTASDDSAKFKLLLCVIVLLPLCHWVYFTCLVSFLSSTLELYMFYARCWCFYFMLCRHIPLSWSHCCASCHPLQKGKCVDVFRCFGHWSFTRFQCWS